jgi:large subunit ribosomal protein L7/L12
MSPAETKAEKEEKKPAEAKAKKEIKLTTKEEIIAAVKSMTVVDLADLIKALETEFGVSASSVAVAAAPATPAAAPSQPAEAALEEEKTEFSVTLRSIGERKIEVIKAIREVTDLGLKQAKDFVEAAPQLIKEAVSKEEANVIKQKLEAAGAVVEIK